VDVEGGEEVDDGEAIADRTGRHLTTLGVDAVVDPGDDRPPLVHHHRPPGGMGASVRAGVDVTVVTPDDVGRERLPSHRVHRLPQPGAPENAPVVSSARITSS